ncbi:MAG: hypothetical protein HY841_08835 [Bacteroidetes bacterium]|nr:hypothetical protein [Bacteroidota bacterium]
MKIIITLILAAAIIFLAARALTKTTITEVTLMKDITDAHLSQPYPEDVLRLYDLKKDKWSGSVFRFINISDVNYNNVSQTSIESASQWLSNDFERDEEVKQFVGSIKRILTDTMNEKIGRNRSSVFVPVAHELKRLNESKADRKILLLYSDLMENSEELSFYKSEKLILLKKNPQFFRDYFDKQAKLDSLTGIEIHIVYQPKDTKENQEFIVVSEFYKVFLESKGAKVEISANLVYE